MDYYNGYAPNEERTKKFRRQPRAKGHTLIEIRSKRLGNSWTIRYTIVCECGHRNSSRTSAARADYGYAAHIKKVTATTN